MKVRRAREEKGRSLPAWRAESQWFGVILRWLCAATTVTVQCSMMLEKHVHRHDGLADINVQQQSNSNRAPRLPVLNTENHGMAGRRQLSGLVCALYLHLS